MEVPRRQPMEQRHKAQGMSLAVSLWLSCARSRSRAPSQVTTTCHSTQSEEAFHDGVTREAQAALSAGSH